MTHLPNIDLEDEDGWDEHHSESSSDEEEDETEPGGKPFVPDNY